MKIKAALLALVLWACLLIPLKAQITVGGLIDFNIAGLNVSPGGTGEDYSSILGLGLGGIVSYPLNDALALQAEPMILRKGGKVSEFNETAKLKFLFIEIPVFIRYSFDLDKSFVPYAMLGPSLGFRTSAKVVFQDGSSFKPNDEFSVFDLGIGLGGGVELPYDKYIFFGEIRYVFGLIDINKEAGESTVKNRGLQLVFGVKVPIG